MRPRLVPSIGKLAIAATVVAVPLSVGTLAYAGTYSSPSITASDTTPAPGGSVAVKGTGFRPDSSVTVEIHSVAVVLAQLSADADGDASTTVTVPSTFAAGSSHEITLSGLDPAGASHVDSVPIVLSSATSASTSSSSSLPFTGLDVAAAGTTAAGLIGFGSFLVFTSRRKKAAQGDAAA